MSLLSLKHLQCEDAAYDWVEARVWPKGATCPHCGEQKRAKKMGGKATRKGLYKCYACRKQFNVKVGTIFEKSHIKMHIWLQAIYLMVGSKKGISSHQLHRTLGVTVKTAWFMSHRIREAMRQGTLSPMGGDGGSGIVEVDETFIGKKKGSTKNPRGGWAHKQAVLALVERGGEVRSFHIDRANTPIIRDVVNENVQKEAFLMTDEARYYIKAGKKYRGHFTVNHKQGQYVDGPIHTNTIEGVFSIFKRGMKGVYQHCDEKHLHRYLAEFDFRYNHRMKLGVTDEMRAEKAVEGIVGKRLTYQTANPKVTPDAQEESPRTH